MCFESEHIIALRFDGDVTLRRIFPVLSHLLGKKKGHLCIVLCKVARVPRLYATLWCVVWC